jgi:hypothetical protein
MTGAPLTPADPADVAQAIHYAMRFGLNGKPLGKKIRKDAEWMARHIVEHLAPANFKVVLSLILKRCVTVMAGPVRRAGAEDAARDRRQRRHG